jgi:hypothetical protein
MKGNNMRGNQRGMTLIGSASADRRLLLRYMAMVLGPAYTEFWGVQKAMTSSREYHPAVDRHGRDRKMLDKQFNVGYVDNVMSKDAKLIRDRGRQRPQPGVRSPQALRLQHRLRHQVSRTK